jgi:hypothetical protein
MKKVDNNKNITSGGIIIHGHIITRSVGLRTTLQVYKSLGHVTLPRMFKLSTAPTVTAALRVIKGDKKGTQCPGVQLGHPVPGGYKYGDLALQGGGVSGETVKYGREFCGTLT